MRVLTTYCPHCDANVLVSWELDGSTTSTNANPEHAHPVAWLKCERGHVLGRFGVAAGTNEALDIMIRRRTQDEPA